MKCAWPLHQQHRSSFLKACYQQAAPSYWFICVSHHSYVYLISIDFGHPLWFVIFVTFSWNSFIFKMTFSSTQRPLINVPVPLAWPTLSFLSPQHDRYNNNTRVPTRLCKHLSPTMGLVYTLGDLFRIRDSMSRTVSPVLLHQLSSLFARKKVRGRSGGLRHARPIPVLITRQTFDDCSFYTDWHPRKS